MNSAREYSEKIAKRNTVSWRRHLAKTISYRILSSCLGFIILSTTTGSLKIGATFTIAELLYKPLLYFIHERIWYKWIKIGYRK